MKTLEAHEMIAEAHASDPQAIAGWLPEGVEPQHPQGMDPTVALLVAGAELSGQFGDCRTIYDLQEAFGQFSTLLSADVFTGEQWNYATLEVIGKLMAWGDGVASHERN